MRPFFEALSILLKYRLLMWTNVPRRRGNRRVPLWLYVLLLGVAIGSFGVPGYFLMRNTFALYSQFFVGTLTLADLFLEISLIGILVLVLLTDTPAVVLNVFMSNDVGYLLTLPISQSAIFYSKIIETLVEGTFPALFFIPVFLAYANVVGMPWYSILFSFVMYTFYVLFLVGIAGLLSMIFSKFASKTGTQRFMFFTGMATLALAYLTMSLTNMPNFKPQNVQVALSAYVSKVNFPFWPSTWFLESIKGNFIFTSILIGASLSIFELSYLISKKSLLSGFSNVKSSSRKSIKVKEYHLHGVFEALLIKEFKIFRREPSILFMILYPAFFPLIFILPNPSRPNSVIIGELASIFMASMYVALSMASLTSIDIKTGWILKTLPLEERALLWAKVVVVSGTYISILALTFSILSIFSGGFWFALLMIALSFPVFLVSSFFGVYAVVKWPNPSGGTRKPLSVTGGIASMLIGLVGAICVGAPTIYFFGNGKIWKFSGLISFFLFLIAPFALEIAFAFIVRKKIFNLNWGDPFEN